MTDKQLRFYFAEIYEAIKGLRIALFQTNLCVQALRALISENSNLERRYGELLTALEHDEHARLFPVLIEELGRRIHALRT